MIQLFPLGRSTEVGGPLVLTGWVVGVDDVGVVEGQGFVVLIEVLLPHV
ncbi:hypothetical protein [Spirosoma gilvum]